MQTIVLPIFIVLANVMIALIIANRVSPNGTASFVMFFILGSIVVFLSLLIFALVDLSHLRVKRKRIINISISFILPLPIIIASFFPLGTDSDSDDCLIKTFDCGHKKSIVFSTDCSWEGARPFYYHVSAEGQDVIPRTSIYQGTEHWPYDLHDLTYTLVTSNESHIVAVISEELPYTPLVIHDFETGDSWPYGGKASRQRLRERLEIDHPEISLQAMLKDKQYLRNVTVLDLSDRPLTDSHLAYLQNLKNIHTLYLARTRITDEGLPHLLTLPNLTQVWLTNTCITDNGLIILHRMPQLLVVGVNNTHVTADGVNTLRRMRPNTAIVYENE